MKRLFLFLVIVTLFISGCTSQKKTTTYPLDIIPFICVYENDSTSVLLSELFYADSYESVVFHSDNSVIADYDSLEMSLIIHAVNPQRTIELLPFTFKNVDYVIPLKIESKIPKTFQFSPPDTPKVISVFGSFNNWNRYEIFMEDEDNDEIYTATTFFDPGRYEYKFFVDGIEYLDPANPDSIPNGLGGFNSILSVEPTFQGREPFIFPDKIVAGENGRIDFHYIIDRGDFNTPLSKSHFVALFDNHRIPDKNIIVFDDANKMVVSLNHRDFSLDGLHRIRCVLTNATIRSNIVETYVKDGQVLPQKNEKIVWNDAIIYSLMIDRFYNGNMENDDPIEHPQLSDRVNFQGGDLEGIIKKIEDGYFNRLGVNTLWISPVYETTDKAFRETPPPHRWFTGYHGYWPIHPRNIEPRFGSNEILKEFITKAHKNDLWVLKDFVSNHVHEEHPYFQGHRDWFGELELPDGRLNLRLWDEYRLTTWFDPYLPSFDYEGSREALETVTNDALWWLETFSFDGFRHDAVKHVPNTFWRELTRKLRKNFPNKNFYQIGETFGDYKLVSSYVSNGQLSAQFNFNLYWPARMAFVTDSSDFKYLQMEMEKSLDYYGQLHVMGNIMDSHDQPRFAAYAEGDLAWDEDAVEAGWNRDIHVDNPRTYKLINLYMTYLLTTPGVPIIYYGDEIGMTGAADPDNRRMMRWGKEVKDEEKKLRMQISRLIDIRNTHSSLRYGIFYPIKADHVTYAYLRRDFLETLLVVIYRSDNQGTITLNFPQELHLQQAQSLYGSDLVTWENNTLIIHSQPLQGHIFLLR
ncbi:MAG: alpha-amylase family glycosyl hydrolase [Candidatus Marinimicrobia bacterium]|nr:alpha-amylase family glycosyl hydrolase [Candidatus Neomarinimicrobiota bacterium]